MHTPIAIAARQPITPPIIAGSTEDDRLVTDWPVFIAPSSIIVVTDGNRLLAAGDTDEKDDVGNTEL